VPVSSTSRLPLNCRYRTSYDRSATSRLETILQRILIVEDSATMRSLLASSLEELEIPVKIIEAESGFEALRFLPRESFDLVVTDINMPDINGLELVSFIRNNEKYAKIPLVIVSTEGSERDRDKGLGLGADAYLVKPFDPETLRQVVTDLLAGQSEEG
jgi:two-component system chemotaxis response regulator CheY